MTAFKPHDYQHDIIEFIQKNKRCGVWAAMGTGKTVSTLTALDHLSQVEDVFPALVLAPLRVAKSGARQQGSPNQPCLSHAPMPARRCACTTCARAC